MFVLHRQLVLPQANRTRDTLTDDITIDDLGSIIETLLHPIFIKSPQLASTPGVLGLSIYICIDHTLCLLRQEKPIARVLPSITTLFNLLQTPFVCLNEVWEVLGNSRRRITCVLFQPLIAAVSRRELHAWEFIHLVEVHLMLDEKIPILYESLPTIFYHLVRM
ncbi:hypothetical protein H2248_002960 [Termitomyces sp. 'cryptogamus']|nr:hypothetical protein H2248_002960 [Termitomyces sp. 'cryptogamus']